MPAQNTDILAAATLLQARLSELAELAGVGVVADIDQDLKTQKEIEKKKNAGAVVVIEPVSGDMTDPTSKALHMDVHYVVSLWIHPGQTNDHAYTPGQRLIAIMQSMQLWVPFETSIATHRFEVQGWDKIDDNNFNLRAITAQLTEVYK